ncbi:MAG: DNA helicase RecQ [Clostridia bacterium]|nr:DNA helicase RecQ [Clostridia bacterium]
MTKYDVLRQYFGYSSFREGQDSLIDEIICGRDVLGIMPTGGGKSLCYQIPALMFRGITFVVSPLISLMKDQVMALKSANVPAAYINSSLTYNQLLKVYDNLRAGMYKIVYIAPERLEAEGFRDLASALDIAMIAVDEAHCVSQWGNDFRPSYLKIARFISSLPHRPVVAAFTATATELVRDDITEKLALCAPFRIVTGFDRPNLNFEVHSPRQKKDALIDLIRQRHDKSGIVYCQTRRNVEKICDLLNENGFAATRYHAGLDDVERVRNQEDFVYDRKNIMVATNAFGMGIDKSNVSYVIHFNMPMSLEAYYQEAGRAGRDGAPADCILLYSPSDIQTAKMLLENSDIPEDADEEFVELQRSLDYERLERMIAYCKHTGCLRGNILDYFGEEHGEECGNCLNCRTTFIERDVTTEAKKILSCIKRAKDKLGFSVGMALIVRTLHGSRDKRIGELGLDRISTYGIMSEESRSFINDVVNHLCTLGYIGKNTEYGSVFMTELANDILFGGVTVTMKFKEERRVPKSDKSASVSEKTVTDSGLYEHLRKLRMEIANEQGVPAYIVFTNATLADMAAKKPLDMGEFLCVSGVGEQKARAYGARFIKAIGEYIHGNV